MQLHVIGSGDAFGSGGRFQTCFALRDHGRAVLIDCGATSLTAMKRAGVNPLEIDAVVVTHLHGDHFGGLPFLVLDAQFSRRTEPLSVFGPPGTSQRLADSMEVLYPGSTGVTRRFDVVVTELAPDGTPAHRDGLTVRGYEVDHASGAPPLGVAVDTGDVRVAYTGDTAWTPAIRSVAAGANLLIAEAYTWDNDVRYHLSHRTLEEHLHEIDAGRVLLTHMSPAMLAHEPEACAETAHDDMTIRL